jgi:hypothetical protein
MAQDHLTKLHINLKFFPGQKIDRWTTGTRRYACLDCTQCRDVVAHDGGDYKSFWEVGAAGGWTKRAGSSRVWIRVRSPASIAVQRERSERWNRRASGSTHRR